MLAREAVLKAIHKLHDQRVLSDKTRALVDSVSPLTINQRKVSGIGGDLCGAKVTGEDRQCKRFPRHAWKLGSGNRKQAFDQAIPLLVAPR